LHLPRYGLGHKDYENTEALKTITAEEAKIKENLAKAGRQLRGFARTNLFKRLESSGYSFLLSISRHILRNYLFIYAIENAFEFPVGKQEGDIISDDKRPELKNLIPELPHVVYSTKKTESREASAAGHLLGVAGELPSQETAPGVIVYARTSDDNDSLAWISEKGEMISQSPLEILKALKCDYTEPALPKQEEHHDLVKKAIVYISELNDKIGGQLGRSTGARYRAFSRLDWWLSQNKDGLFVTEEIKRTHQDIYRFPLTEEAIDAINRELKSGIDNDKLVEMLCSLNEQDKLCIRNDDEQEPKEARIICSMGLAL
jgi:hypothetical protein